MKLKKRTSSLSNFFSLSKSTARCLHACKIQTVSEFYLVRVFFYCDNYMMQVLKTLNILLQLSVTIRACEKSRTAFICLFIQVFFSFCWRMKREWMTGDAQWWFLKAFSAHIRENWSRIVGKRQESKWFRLSKVLSLSSKGFFHFRYNYYCFI